jgi:hypothetical protein
MQTAMSTETKTAELPGVVYRTACQNRDVETLLICE